jgi:hypothetical protein
MVVRHRALALLTRYSKALIRLSCRGTESLILRSLSDQAGLSARWSRDAWLDYLSMRSHEMLRFLTLIESCVPLSLFLTKCPGCEVLQSSSPVMQSLSQLRRGFLLHKFKKYNRSNISL